MQSVAGVMLVLLVASLASTRAVAQDDAARAEARALAQRGVAAFAADDYELALTQLEGAYALVPLAAVRFNVALCLERLARFREAAEAFDAVASSDELTPAQREEATARAATLRERLATLELIAPSGAEIRASGQTCTAPCVLVLDPGAHDLGVRFEGETTLRHLVLDRGEHRVLDASPIRRPSYEPSPLLWSGGATLVLGIGGTIGFGLWTEALRAEFDRGPTDALADHGELARGLTNGFIGLAALGAGLLIVELVLELSRPSEAPSDPLEASDPPVVGANLPVR